MAEPALTLEGQMEEGHLVVHLDGPLVVELVRGVLERHGPQHNISYRNTGCGWEGGAYTIGTPYSSQIAPSGLTRNPVAPFLHVIGHTLWVRDFQDLKPEVQDALRESLRQGGIEIRVAEPRS